MARQKKYIEATKHLTKRVPASQLSKCHEIIDEYLTPFEAPKVNQSNNLVTPRTMSAQEPAFNQDYDFYKEQVATLRAEKAELIEALRLMAQRTLAKYETK